MGRRTFLARSNSPARTGTGKYYFSLFSCPRAGLATLTGRSVHLFAISDDHTYIHTAVVPTAFCRKNVALKSNRVDGSQTPAAHRNHVSHSHLHHPCCVASYAGCWGDV